VVRKSKNKDLGQISQMLVYDNKLHRIVGKSALLVSVVQFLNGGMFVYILCSIARTLIFDDNVDGATVAFNIK
jgi:hypothetical protein